MMKDSNDINSILNLKMNLNIDKKQPYSLVITENKYIHL